jgi:hypothetical protein
MKLRASGLFAGNRMKLRIGLVAALLAAGLFASAGPAFSQGCSMCYSTAKATSAAGQRAITRGVLLLLIPPVVFMTLGIALAFRYSKKRDSEQQESLRFTEN